MKSAASRRKRWNSEQEKRDWLASAVGQAWLRKKIAEKHAARPPVLIPERLQRTRFPFKATINDLPCQVERIGGELQVRVDARALADELKAMARAAD